MKGLALQQAIFLAKHVFEQRLLETMQLTKVSAPLFVPSSSGLQDNLNGIERPVSFTVKTIKGEYYEIVHSLAKWKRQALRHYDVPAGEGICTDMRAIRPDEEDLSSHLHSIYVDQWDWEKVIRPEDRQIDYLMQTVRDLYRVIYDSAASINQTYGLPDFLPEQIHFIHADELARKWPELSPKERENKICADKKAVFLMGIGGTLSDGKPHDGRAPDYDDWSTVTEKGPGLNGDIIVWNPILERAFELSSMGIRVDQAAMEKQLAICGCPHRAEHPWHQALLAGKLPCSIGGGIGQSRMAMLLLQRHHIGEVQASAWPVEVLADCLAMGIDLL